MCFLFSLNFYIIKIKLWQSCGIIKFNLANIYGDPFVSPSLPWSLQELPFSCKSECERVWSRCDRKLNFTVEGSSLRRHRVRRNFLLDLGESIRLDLQRGKSFQMRGTEVDVSRAWLILGQRRDRMRKASPGFRLRDIPGNEAAGPQEAWSLPGASLGSYCQGKGERQGKGRSNLMNVTQK